MKIVHMQAELQAKQVKKSIKELRVEKARLWIAQQNAKLSKTANQHYAPKIEELRQIYPGFFKKIYD